MKKSKIGILTWHYYPNFGSALQAYALQNMVESLGYKAKIINYRDEKYGKYNFLTLLKMSIKYPLCVLQHLGFPVPFRAENGFLYFQKKYLHETTLEQKPDRLSRICNSFDTIICGSDQIWAPNVFNKIYMLDFVPNNIHKISYAASIGLNDIPPELCEVYSKLLSGFERISVRESLGKQLLFKKCDISAELVLDPTLTLGRSELDKIETNIGLVKEDYIFCYFLNPSHTYRTSVEVYAGNHRLSIYGCSANLRDREWIKQTNHKIGPCEFLWLIHHAKVIFTDSYHGTIFSLLYHKDFITFERFKDNDLICQNSRIRQLDDYFGISSRIVRNTSFSEIVIDKYDYNLFDEKLENLKKSSVAFLKAALGE